PQIYTLSLHDALPICPWVFPQLVEAAREWLEHRVHIEPGFSLGHLRLAELQQRAAEDVWHAVTRQPGDGEGRGLIRPILNAGMRSEEHTSELQSRENL